MTRDKLIEYWADWLVDAVAASTQDRKFLRSDPEEDTIATEAIYLNGRKAIEMAFKQWGENNVQQGS